MISLNSTILKQEIINSFKQIQDDICKGLEKLDQSGVTFAEDLWDHNSGGGGRTRVFQKGKVIEKGGVNFSAVDGELPKMLQNELGLDEGSFSATGVSIVLHSTSPHIPIIHMNIRYFETSNGLFWFGGGIDLTPHYIVDDLAKSFHLKLKNICDIFDPNFYADHKKWADDYFYIPHRDETRGVGGIFFDKLSESNTNISKKDLFEYVKALGNSFVEIYSEQVIAGREKSFSEDEKKWQMYRRGRYVEFNLVYDRGTKFGLQTSGRIESILMSLPENASWVYNFKAKEDSEEQYTLDNLKKGIDWIKIK